LLEGRGGDFAPAGEFLFVRDKKEPKSASADGCPAELDFAPASLRSNSRRKYEGLLRRQHTTWNVARFVFLVCADVALMCFTLLNFIKNSSLSSCIIFTNYWKSIQIPRQYFYFLLL
jgi:hypothetical protein